MEIKTKFNINETVLILNNDTVFELTVYEGLIKGITNQTDSRQKTTTIYEIETSFDSDPKTITVNREEKDIYKDKVDLTDSIRIKPLHDDFYIDDDFFDDSVIQTKGGSGARGG